MRNLKRIISLIISGAMLTASLAGCDAGGASEKKEEKAETAESVDYAYDLSQISIDYLSGLDKTVELYFLMEMDEIRDEAEVEEIVNLLDTYSEFDCIDFKDLDPDMNPDIIEELNPDGLMTISKGDMIVKCDDNIRHIQAASMYSYEFDEDGIVTEELFNGENLITGSVMAVAENLNSAVYFLTGHGEKTLEADYTQFHKNLRNFNYSPKELNLATADAVPEDAAIIIAAAPQSDITDDEQAKLEEYMDRGGNLSLLMSPNESDIEYENLTEIMMQYGLAIDYNTVSETDSANHISGDDSTILVNLVDPSVYTNEVEIDLTSALIEAESLNPFMPASRSLYNIQAENAEDLIVCPLIETYETAIGTPYGGNSDETDMLSGILYLAAYSQDKSRNDSKLVVIGNAEFIDDSHVAEDYTMVPVMLYLTTITWMQSCDIETGIPPKTLN